MKKLRTFRVGIVCLAILGLMLPQTVFAAGPVDTEARGCADVALHAGGVLHGNLVDAQGAPMAGRDVSVWQQEEVVAVAKTDGDGRFVIRGLQGGVYRIESERGAGLYRAWAANTAPPAAEQQVLLVSGENVVRGQYFFDGTMMPGNTVMHIINLGFGITGTTLGVIAVAQNSGSGS